ncbi:MAG TPA: nuclear transport factor 2 family protein [Acidimicrobiales bacterium]|nr:nuclear transport factor 2 family protein [Acidimicrobiales bacterium]
MTTVDRAEVEAAFRHYFLTGPVLEDWAAWSRLFTDDAVYFDHFYGRFRGPAEIQKFLESTMGFAPHVYSPLAWYNIDGDRVVYKVWNRADNPDPAGPPAQFPSLQIIEYAGEGRWRSEEDWWILREMKRFNEEYEAMCAAAARPDFKHEMSRRDWGPIDWARPPEGHRPAPSWERGGSPVVRSVREMDFGERV